MPRRRTATDLAGLELTAVEGGTLLRVRVKASARGGALVAVHGGALKIAVTAPPERGKANRAVLELLARTLGLAPSSLEILSGATSPDKTVRVPLAAESILERLGRARAR